MSDQDGGELDYQTVRQRVVRRLKKRALFYADLVFWMLFTIGTQSRPNDFYARMAVIPVILWFLVLVVHFVYAFEIWSRMIERSTQREIERLQQQGHRVVSSRDAKLKRQQVARLSDDGEIVYEDEPARQAARSRQTDGDGRA
jgi:uncharacterized membrane protein